MRKHHRHPRTFLAAMAASCVITAAHAAGTWDRERRVIVKAEHGELGANPRYVVINLSGEPCQLYADYCQRGDMENRIKEQKLDMFSDRTSAHTWWANQFRMLLSSFACVLMHTIRRLGLLCTELARAQCNTIRLKLLKIGAVVTRNTRRVRLHLSSACPYQELFWIDVHYDKGHGMVWSQTTLL